MCRRNLSELFPDHATFFEDEPTTDVAIAHEDEPTTDVAIARDRSSGTAFL